MRHRHHIMIAVGVVPALFGLGGCRGHDSSQLDHLQSAITKAELGFVDVGTSESTDSEGHDWDANVWVVVNPGQDVTASQLRQVIELAVPYLDGYDTVTISARDTNLDVVDLQADYTSLGFPLPDPSWIGADPTKLWTTRAQAVEILKLED